MCATCHTKRDPAFPSDLKLGKKCKDCHGALENVYPKWELKSGPPVRIGEVKVPAGSPAAAEKVKADLRWMLERRGFDVVGKGVSVPVADLQIEIRPLREDRFVARDEAVLRASLVCEVRKGAGENVLFRRRVLSRPEFGKEPVETGIRAARDGFQVLAGHLAEALRSAVGKGAGGKTRGDK
jgi:hypothetical protein